MNTDLNWINKYFEPKKKPQSIIRISSSAPGILKSRLLNIEKEFPENFRSRVANSAKSVTNSVSGGVSNLSEIVMEKLKSAPKKQDFTSAKLPDKGLASLSFIALLSKTKKMWICKELLRRSFTVVKSLPLYIVDKAWNTAVGLSSYSLIFSMIYPIRILGSIRFKPIGILLDIKDKLLTKIIDAKAQIYSQLLLVSRSIKSKFGAPIKKVEHPTAENMHNFVHYVATKIFTCSTTITVAILSNMQPKPCVNTTTSENIYAYLVNIPKVVVAFASTFDLK